MDVSMTVGDRLIVSGGQQGVVSPIPSVVRSATGVMGYSHWVTEVFRKWSPGHGAEIAIPWSQSINMDEVVRHVK